MTEKGDFPGTHYLEQGHGPCCRPAEPAHAQRSESGWSWGDTPRGQMGAWVSFICVVFMVFQSRTGRRWRVDACVLVCEKARGMYYIGPVGVRLGLPRNSL